MKYYRLIFAALVGIIYLLQNFVNHRLFFQYLDINVHENISHQRAKMHHGVLLRTS